MSQTQECAPNFRKHRVIEPEDTPKSKKPKKATKKAATEEE